jgi:hypothetical protein
VRGLVVVAAVALVAGCAGAGALETATSVPKTPRRPDGIVLEPAPALPVAMERASASGIVALREPLVEEVVRAYLRAFELEDIDALEQLLAQDAAPLGRGGGKQQLLELWRSKMKNFEYQKLAGVEVARIAQIERHSYESLSASAGPMRPAEMRPGDLFVRVPIATPRIGSDQLFGDILVLLLRREGGRLKLAGQADENGT